MLEVRKYLYTFVLYKLKDIYYDCKLVAEPMEGNVSVFNIKGGNS